MKIPIMPRFDIVYHDSDRMLCGRCEFNHEGYCILFDENMEYDETNKAPVRSEKCLLAEMNSDEFESHVPLATQMKLNEYYSRRT